MKGRSRDLVLLLEATSPAEAALVRGLLEPEGIPCLVEGHGLGDVAQYELHKIPYQQLPNVYVPRAAEDRARALLARAWGRVPDAQPVREPSAPRRTTVLFLVACLAALLAILFWLAR